MKVPFSIAFALLGCLSLFGCAHTSGGPSAPVITGQYARQLIVEEDAQLVDVRSAAEFDMGHIEGAISVPLGRVTTDGSIDGQRPVIVYCLSGHRSARAAVELMSNGNEEVYDLGSIRNWD